MHSFCVKRSWLDPPVRSWLESPLAAKCRLCYVLSEGKMQVYFTSVEWQSNTEGVVDVNKSGLMFITFNSQVVIGLSLVKHFVDEGYLGWILWIPQQSSCIHTSISVVKNVIAITSG